MRLSVIGIGGEPGTGKSTLMRAVRKALPPGQDFKWKLVRGTIHKLAAADVYVFGTYHAEDAFQGTDRLSMGCQPDAVALLDHLAAQPEGCRSVVLFEGDRLFNGKFLDAVKARTPHHRFILLQAAAATLAERHVARGDSQTATFLKGRATKYANLWRSHGLGALPHEGTADTAAIATQVLAFIGV